MFLSKLFYSPVVEMARWEVRRFNYWCRRVEQIQRRVLLEKISLNGDSRIGQAMGMSSIGSVAQFRSRVPITTYNDYLEAIEKCKAGESRAMLGPGQKIEMFALTSGTTGQPKFIPITKKFLREYCRGWLIWGFYAYNGRSLGHTLLLPIISPSCEFTTAAGIPCGAISGLTNDCQNWITKHLFAVPKEVYRIQDLDAKYYTLGRFAIEKRVAAINSANPSTILTVFRLINNRRNEIISDVEKGTLDGVDKLSDEQRKCLLPMLKPNPRRAQVLRTLMEQEGGLFPKHYWRDLFIVSNWRGGTLGRYLDFYPEFFGNVQVRDIGLIASEGRMSIPLSANGSEGVLDVLSHFFEFVPEDSIEDKAPRTYLAHELEKGKRYFMLLTTSSGFYRYDIRDLVEITGFHHQAPVLRFLNKGKHFSSITGEKISEFQVVEAVNNTARAFNVRLENYCVFPKWGAMPRYGLMVEEGMVGAKGAWAGFLRELDGRLRRLNCEYDSKRASGRLGGIGLFFIPENAFAAWKNERLREQGGRVEQYKHVFLCPEDGFEKQFQIVREFYVTDFMECKVP